MKEALEEPRVFSDLFRKYLASRCSPEEYDDLMTLLKTKKYEAEALDLIDNQLSQTLPVNQLDPGLDGRLEERLQQILQAQPIPAKQDIPPPPED